MTGILPAATDSTGCTLALRIATYSRAMSVVTGQARRRWGVVLAAVAVLMCAPLVSAAATRWVTGSGGDPASSSRDLITRAMNSQDVAYQGMATSRGNLGLPDLPSVDSVTAALGGTTRSRVWWSAENLWRVSVITATGEQGIYDRAGQTYLWDYEQNAITRVDGVPELRLPRADDLLPPQATWRLLAGTGPADRVEAIKGARRIAGAQAQGIRIRPGDTRSTIGHIDIWIEQQHGLPVAISIADANGVTALESQFSDLDFGQPAPALLRVPFHRGMQISDTPAPDLASRINRFGAFRLPDRLAGFGTSAPIVGGTATYGTGLVRFVVLPVMRRNSDDWVDAARTGASEDRSLTGGEGLRITAGALNLVVARATTGATYAITGLVSPEILFQAAEELFAHPPARRGFFS